MAAVGDGGEGLVGRQAGRQNVREKIEQARMNERASDRIDRPTNVHVRPALRDHSRRQAGRQAGRRPCDLIPVPYRSFLERARWALASLNRCNWSDSSPLLDPRDKKTSPQRVGHRQRVLSLTR